MKNNFAQILAASSLVAVSSILAVNPAQAAVFLGIGDKLNITGSVSNVPLGTSANQITFNPTGDVFESGFIFGGSTDIGEYGNFGVQDNSSGVFALYANSGTVIADYQILSFDIQDAAFVTPTGNAATPSSIVTGPNFLANDLAPFYVGTAPGGATNIFGNNTLALTAGPFLTLEAGLSSRNPDIEVFLTEITSFGTTIDEGSGTATTKVAGKVTFFADNKALGVGSFSTDFVPAGPGIVNQPWSASFIVDELHVSVPESSPVSALIGLGLVSSAFAFRKKSKLA